MIEGWVYLYLGLKSLIEGMEKSYYDETTIIEELRRNPECLGEPYRYYLQECQGLSDPYWHIKKNPPIDFDKTIEEMGEWGQGIMNGKTIL
jgi:hypothetical protein